MKRSRGSKKKSKSLSLSSDKVKQEPKKPCEVCGDVGIEKLMMICFKCRETREHSYCARVFLPSVPTIWLCEVCRSSPGTVEISDVAEKRMDLETRVADCSPDTKKSKKSREEYNERSNDVEKVVEARMSLPVLQASVSEITANFSLRIHLPLQPHKGLVAKEASSVPNDTSEDKRQHQVPLVFTKKPRKFRLTGKHLSQPHQSLISSRDQS